MRSIRKRVQAVAITFAILFASLAPGLDNSALAASAGGRKSHRAVKTKGSNKKASRRAGRGRSRTRARSGRGRGRGRYARSKRGRQSVAQDYSTSGRPAATGIPTERVTEIQKALIKLGYLSGDPSGQYDDDTVQAMKQFQTANQLTATGLPSAHALKRLGVPKRSSDSYAVPVKSGGQSETL
jgi:hypothetical protein